MNDAGGSPMSALFLSAVEATLAFGGNGAISDDPDDPGGLTRWEISKSAYPNLDIAKLTRDQAIGILFTDIWLKRRINQLPDWAAPKVFDTEVLAGSWGIRILQQNLGIPDDGVIGLRTLTSCRCVRDPQIFMEMYRHLLKNHYDRICAVHPELAKFQRGWERRALA